VDWVFAALLLSLFVLPGLLYIHWRRSGIAAHEQVYRSRYADALAATGCHWMKSVKHLGGHPLLPYDERIVIGIQDKVRISFYDYDLKHLHSAPVKQVVGTPQTRNVTANTVGVSGGSQTNHHWPHHGNRHHQSSTMTIHSSTTDVDARPDALLLSLTINHKSYSVLFGMKRDEPLELLDRLIKAQF